MGIRYDLSYQEDYGHAILGKSNAKIQVLEFYRTEVITRISPASKKLIERYYFRIIDLKNPDKGSQLLSVGRQLYQQIVEKIAEPPKKSEWRWYWEKKNLAWLLERLGWLAKVPEPVYICEINKEVNKKGFHTYHVKWSDS